MSRARPQAMVLAAGLGTRLWPLTEELAKPAVPFIGKPLIGWVLDLLERHGIDRSVVNTHHRPESVRAALEGRRGVSVVHETEILGTAGALENALRTGLLEPHRDVIVVNAKLFTDYDVEALWQTHLARNAAVTMGLWPNPAREAFREVFLDDGRVTGFGEGRVPKGPNPWLFTGIHILRADVVSSIPAGFSDTVADVYPRYIERGEIFAHLESRGRWWEFSTLERYFELHRKAIDEGLWTNGSTITSPGAEIQPGAVAERSVLWPGARVEAGARVVDCVLGTGVHVRRGSNLERSVVVRADTLGTNPERGEIREDLLIVPLSV